MLANQISGASFLRRPFGTSRYQRFRRKLARADRRTYDVGDRRSIHIARMTSVIADQSISLDGFSAGPNQHPANPMGDGGPRLHEWPTAPGTPGAAVLDAYWARVGAVILGRRMYDQGVAFWDGKNPWGIPAFVLTHDLGDALSKSGYRPFTFVTDGMEGALGQARTVAGDKDVAVAGGATTIRQFIAAGLLDELHLRLVPIMLGSGVRMFDGVGGIPVRLESAGVIVSPGVTHLAYRLVR